MSATLLQFRPKPGLRRYEPRIRWGVYTPPPGSVVVVRKYMANGGETVFDVEVEEHGGQDGFAVIATYNDPEDARHSAEMYATAHRIEVAS